MELVKAGASRQEMHEVIRRHSLAAWDAIARGQANPLGELLEKDPEVLAHMPAERVRSLLFAGNYVGDAPHRARLLAQSIREVLAQN
jgi:adenylosuccinate lyase